jgi:hypothetical protein
MNNFLIEGLGEVLVDSPDPFFYQALAVPADCRATRVLDIYGGYNSWLIRNISFFSAYETPVEWYAILPDDSLVTGLRRKRPGVLYFCGGYEKQRFQRGLFDFQYLSSGLLQVSNPSAFFDMVCLNTAPGGRLLLRYVCPQWLQKMELAGSESEYSVLEWWEPMKLCRLLEEAGFACVTFWPKVHKPTDEDYACAENYCRLMAETDPHKSEMALSAAAYFANDRVRPAEVDYIELIAVKRGMV